MNISRLVVITLSIIHLTVSLPLLSPIDIPLIDALTGHTQPPPPIMTTEHTPECRPINQGSLTCCNAKLDGGNAIVQSLALLTGYELPKNTINGIECHRDDKCAAPKYRLCCQSVLIEPAAALYCQSASTHA
ncbi:hypothetical protein BJ878DRAFT_104627 [Calycina marina]|uniref:Hydrophobin n=1 Tax=Calycina marina TaxID=1763456 RepID=A0A9P7Z1Y1_9HELO|nr:hypothetical protein BJ878DRAFT_104627 [Calycina marina]